MSKTNMLSRWLPLFLVATAMLLTLSAAPDAWAQAGEAAADATSEAAPAADAAEGDEAEYGPSWLGFFGQLHVVVLHLPIGLLLGAFILEFFGMFSRSRGYDVAATWTLFLGTAAAAVAIAFGIFLEETTPPGHYDALSMSWHKWLGIAMGGLALIACVTKIAAVRNQWQDDQRGPGGLSLLIARLSLIGMAVLIPVVGHLGGNMTHGADQVISKAPFEVPEVALEALYFPNDPPVQATAVAGTVEARWISEVQPIMDAHCVRCHGDAKQQAGLRLDTLEAALQGSEYGQVISQGSAEQSRLYQVVCLPPEDDYFMPPNKTELNLEEMRTLARWLIDSIDLGKEPPAGDGTGDGEPDEPEGPAYDVAAAEQLISHGASVAPEAQGSEYVFVSFANQRGPVPAEALAALEPLADSIKRLDFSGSGVTDADLGNLPDLPALERLYLKDTAITDAGLADLPEMFSLTYLNLFGTQVTDAGLEALEDIVTLEAVYLSETGVTLEGVQQLREALGDEVEVIYDDTVGLAPASDAGQATEPTVMVNTVCPVSGSAPANAAHTLEHDGRLIGFCCDDCKAKFAADPATYLANLP